MSNSTFRPSERLVATQPKTLFVADTNEEYERIKALVEKLSYPVEVSHAQDLIPEFRSTKPRGNSCSTIAAEKVRMWSRIWDVLPDELKRQRLETANVHQRDAYVVACSGGYHFMDTDLSKAGFVSELGPDLQKRLLAQGNIPGVFFKEVEDELGGVEELGPRPN